MSSIHPNIPYHLETAGKFMGYIFSCDKPEHEFSGIFFKKQAERALWWATKWNPWWNEPGF